MRELCNQSTKFPTRLPTKEGSHEYRRVQSSFVGSFVGNFVERSLLPAQRSKPGVEILFHHESLDVYRVGLEFMRWFIRLPGGGDLRDRLCREVDKAATSVVLNVAEGNGRYSELDHRRFLEIAANSAVRRQLTWTSTNKRRCPPARNRRAGNFMSRMVAMVSRF